MYNFYGLQLYVRKQTKNALEYLKTIIDDATIERYPKKDTARTISYKIIIKKDSFSKTFYLNVFSNDEMSVIQSLEINNYTIYNYRKIETAILSLEDEIFISKNPKIKNMMNTIRCADNICPICNTQINESVNDIANANISLSCPNNCYDVNIIKRMENENNLLTKTTFFKNEATIETRYIATASKIGDTKDLRLQFEKRIENIHDIHNKINYWKENDRYLSKILGGF